MPSIFLKTNSTVDEAINNFYKKLFDENKEQEMNVTDANFEESKHPRANNGQFTSGGGSSGGSAKPQSSKKPTTQASEAKNFYGANLSDRGYKIVKSVEGKPLSAGRINYFKKYYDNTQEGLHIYNALMNVRNAKTKLHNTPGLKVDKLLISKLENKLQDKFNKWERANHKKNTAGDSGVNASTCDADFQSKIEEIRTMIDKEKLSALKELVAMLESDSPAGDAKPCDELPNNEEKENLFEEKKEDEEVVKDEAVDKRELIREIGAIAGKGGLSEEDVRTLMQKAEQLAYSDSERSADDEEEEIIEEKMEEQPEEKKESEDALPKKIFEMLADRDALVNKVKPLIGNFDFSKMTSEQVAKYACDKLDIKSDTPRAALDGYLKGYSKSKMYSIDSTAQHIETTNSQLEKYLKGE